MSVLNGASASFSNPDICLTLSIKTKFVFLSPNLFALAEPSKLSPVVAKKSGIRSIRKNK